MQQSLVGLELPIDLVEGAPRITMYGTQRAIVENHRGILDYSDRTIRLDTAQGPCVVSGDKLILKNFDEGTAVIDGAIAAVQVWGQPT